MRRCETRVCWRKEVDQKLKRLHSIIGADAALEKGDFAGKTMIGKSIGREAKATSFYILARPNGFAFLLKTSIGEGEILVKAPFGVASCRQPAVVFVDEIDSLLSQLKSEGEHESSRQLKTQSSLKWKALTVAVSTNYVNRLFLKTLSARSSPKYVQLIDLKNSMRLQDGASQREANPWIIKNVLEKDGLFNLSNETTDTICRLTKGRTNH
ncbi:ATPase family AAA domain-containing protein FIGL1-like [Salvia splendens]|uniref:ATPase family AAA domain-containing protein FIGL1-like n=1 Tax=Salvia splendens TaxID=180675 RepID=UPI001C27C7F1|nr:ATPase family AAA domain-containing protein FIGL1-like [Salvia splendens]